VTTSCCGTAWPVSLGFSGLFDDFAFFSVLAVDIEALLEGFRRTSQLPLYQFYASRQTSHVFEKTF
jgi:hypothetical protein